jgi:TatD DNase family protein
MLIDSHCHLDFDSFDEDRAETIARAQAAGIDRMVTICTRLSRFDEIHAIARAHACVDCSVGIHPHQVAEEGVAPTARLVELAAHPEGSGSAKPVSIITTITAREMNSGKISATTSPPRGKPACP